MSMVKEFKEFAMKGNVVDLAVGVIIGGAFGKIVTSLVDDMIMPLLSVVIGKINFTDLKIVLVEAQGEAAEVAFRYGAFLQNVFNFLIIAFSIFMMVKLMNAARKKEEALPAPPPEPTKTEVLLEEIKEILKKK
ncbi:MAG: large-conductance mechanosensitive channel protein MscL [Peptostreptococcaceae bacterium]|nr:large-conductance mechanosensitive channel protein MscL [Peptostreptococcaceae bacterium]